MDQVRCYRCGSTNIRRATLRVAHLFALFLFRYPARCRICRKRNYVTIRQAFRLDSPPRVR
jgi:hypothetical protein